MKLKDRFYRESLMKKIVLLLILTFLVFTNNVEAVFNELIFSENKSTEGYKP